MDDTRPAGVTLHSLSCPRCAGALRASEGESQLSCGHCGTAYLLDGHEEYGRRYFPAQVDRLQAVGRAAGWLAGLTNSPPGLREAVFTDARLLYVPLWEVRAYVVGWEFGRKRRTKREVVQVGEQAVIQLTLVDEAVEQGFLDERRMYQEATDLAILGLLRPHITGRDRSLPYLPGELEEEAAWLGTDRDARELLARARESFRRPPTGTEVRGSTFFLLKERVSLLYYPLWVLRYRYDERLYDLSVDGCNGVVHAGRAPADNSRRLAVMLGSYAALATCLALLSTAWQAWPVLREAILGCGAIVLAMSLRVYWRFGLLREVQYHEPFSS